MNRAELERRRQAAATRLGLEAPDPFTDGAAVGAVTVVIGPPAAGKSTYVAEHAAAEDLVVDYDRLAAAITPRPNTAAGQYLPPNVHPPAAIPAANALRRLAATAVPEAAVAAGVRAWIIHALPTRAELAAYRAAGAELIAVDPGELEVRRRAAAHRPPAAAAAIARWYAAPPPPAAVDRVVAE